MPKSQLISKTLGNPSDLAMRLAQPLLEVDLEREIEKLEQAEPWMRSGHNAKALVKHPDLRIAITVLKAGCRIQGHKAEARISIQTLKGTLRLHVGAETKELPVDHLLVLDRGTQHDVEALENSAFLLTIAWPGTRG